MIDKKNSDEDFSDEGFDEEFSFDMDEDQSEQSKPFKESKPLVSAPLKKVLINLVLGLSLIASIFGVYQYWATDSKNKIAAKKTSPTSIATPRPASQPAPASAKKEEAGGFSESDMASLMKEQGKSTAPTKGSEAQKGVFVIQNPALTSAQDKIPVKEPNPATAITGIKPAEMAMAALQKAETEQKALEQQAEVQKAKEQQVLAQQVLAQKTQEQKILEQHAELQKADNTLPPLILNPTQGSPAMSMAQTPMPPAQTQAATPTSSEVKEMTQEINKTLEAVSKLNQQMEGNLNQVKYVDAYTREVSLNVEKLNTQVAAMDNRIQTLTNLANSLSKDLGKVRHEVGYAKRVAVAPEDNLDLLSPPKRRADCPIMEEGGDCSGGFAAPRRINAKNCVGCPEDPEYVVHAVIPGRAWLKSCKGQILTVTEGETVGNYGKVLVIDAANSIVLTSSGIAFR